MVHAPASRPLSRLAVPVPADSGSDFRETLMSARPARPQAWRVQRPRGRHPRTHPAAHRRALRCAALSCATLRCTALRCCIKLRLRCALLRACCTCGQEDHFLGCPWGARPAHATHEKSPPTMRPCNPRRLLPGDQGVRRGQRHALHPARLLPPRLHHAALHRQGAPRGGGRGGQEVSGAGALERGL